ncbi:MAG: outer membrane protein transport protein, partial [Pseudomonadota bacterium]
MKKRPFLFIALSFGLLWAPAAFAQQSLIYSQTQINSSPNPVGSGARAMGMGGAFIAIADDATAASWNPGGLMQLERPEFSFVFNFQHRRKELGFSVDRSMNGMNEVYRNDLNYFSAAYPFMAFNKNMIVSLNYQRLYDFYDDLEFNENTKSLSSSGVFVNGKKKVDFRQTGALKALAPAYAIQLTPRLSVGATFNFWTDNLGYDNEWESRTVERAALSLHSMAFNRNTLLKTTSRYVKNEKNKDFEGFNMNFGFLWRITNMITLGGVVKTAFTGEVNRTTSVVSSSATDRSSPTRAVPKVTKENMEMHFPLSYGLGAAFRLSDELSLALDVYRTDWSDYWVKSHGRKTSPITGGKSSTTRIHDTTQVRAGGEYLFVFEKTIIPLRFGVFYDPEPATGHPDDFYGFSMGTGVSLGPVVLDCAYVYRFGRDVRGDMLAREKGKPTFDVDDHSIYISM